MNRVYAWMTLGLAVTGATAWGISRFAQTAFASKGALIVLLIATLAVVELRSITVKEAVRFLGRFLQICHFLTNREEALRFVKLLEEGNDTEEIKVAKEARLMIPLLPERIPHLSKTMKKPVYHPHFAGTETVSRF